MQIANAKGESITVNAAPEFAGDEDDKPAKRAHAKALIEHARMLSDWLAMGYAPVDVVEPSAAQVAEAPKKPRK